MKEDQASTNLRVRLVPYDRDYLDHSWEWLSDPETRRLTATPMLTPEQQERFYESLPRRPDYKIWGVALGERPIGAGGLKNIRNGCGEYWGYIGEKDLWGQGLGRQMLAALEQEARTLKLVTLELKVNADNDRAIRLYRSAGYETTANDLETVVMRKRLA